MKKILAMGELLMDCIQDSNPDNISFQAYPGGAPCNVLSMAANLGCSCFYISCIGNDEFGHVLKKTLREQGIDTTGILQHAVAPTTLAFIMHDKEGDRSFSFYREGCADTQIQPEDVKEEWFEEVSIFHFGSLSLTSEPVRSATNQAICYAKKHHCMISFDPNLRMSLWKDVKDAKTQILRQCSICDILKVSEEELFFITEADTIEEGIMYLKKNFTISLILLTMGHKGSYAYYQDYEVIQPAFLNENTIDTTGAGDTFFGCILAAICKDGMPQSKEKLQEMMKVASAASSIITTRNGALCQMPALEEIEALLYNR